jgi:hypothetical protein
MAYQALGLGTTIGDGTGDTIRAGGDKINDNFVEIYTLLGTGTALTSGISATATVVTLASPVISGVLALDDGSAAAPAFTNNGEASFADGSNTAPSITNTGDTNTGIYFGAADTVNITTGGTKRIEIDSSGLDVTGAISATAGVAGITGIFSGDVTGLTLNATGDTLPNANAAIGYTSVEGLILTGQGSTNDVTIKNDADADVIEIPTGTTNVTFAGNIAIANAGNIGSAGDADAIAIASNGVVTFSQIPVLPANSILIANLVDNSITEAKMANDAISSAELKTLSTLLIKNSGGTTLATFHTAGA